MGTIRRSGVFGDEAFDHPARRVIGTELRVGNEQPPLTFHVHLALAVDHDLGDKGVFEETLSGSMA